MNKKLAGISISLALAACYYNATMADAIARRELAEVQVYPVGEELAWPAAIDALRASGGGTIEEHRDQHMMLTTMQFLAGNGLARGHLAAAFALQLGAPQIYTPPYTPPPYIPPYTPTSTPSAPVHSYQPSMHQRYVSVWVERIDGAHSSIRFSSSPPNRGLERAFHAQVRESLGMPAPADRFPGAPRPPQGDEPQPCAHSDDCDVGVCLEGYCRRQ